LEENSLKLTQTGPILLRLAGKFGCLAGTDDAERFEVLRWLFWDNHNLTGYLATYRFRRTFTPDPDPAVLAFLLHRIDDFLGILDQHVKDRAFVIGDRATIADLSLCAYLSFPENETGYDLGANYPCVRAWLGRVAALPGWRSPYELLARPPP